MSQEAIYETDWSKYKNVSYQRCCTLEFEFRKFFHTCPALMTRKKELEHLVRSYRENKNLRQHFRTKYNFRKKDFYRKIVYHLVDETKDMEKKISNLAKDILFIYSKKEEEREYLSYLSNHLEAEISHREEMRESMMEDFRGCD